MVCSALAELTLSNETSESTVDPTCKCGTVPVEQFVQEVPIPFLLEVQSHDEA